MEPKLKDPSPKDQHVIPNLWKLDFRNVRVRTMTASLPPTVPKLTLKPPLNSQNSRPLTIGHSFRLQAPWRLAEPFS